MNADGEEDKQAGGVAPERQGAGDGSDAESREAGEEVAPKRQEADDGAGAERQEDGEGADAERQEADDETTPESQGAGAAAPDVLDELAELRQRNAELAQKLEDIEQEAKAKRVARIKRGGWIALFAAKVFIGKDLAKAIEEWREAKSVTDPLPTPQTSSLAAAVLARFLRLGLWTVALAIAPTAILVWQNALLVQQNEFLQRQIRQEAVQEFRARRAQLLRTIYDRRECWDGEEQKIDDENPVKDWQPGCPAASIQARASAAETLVQIERVVRESQADWPGVVVLPNTFLMNVNLRGADLIRADLSGAILHGADLSEANLIDVNLHRAELVMADFSESNLRDADLSGALLAGANLSGANLSGADLSGAYLRTANLHRARLGNANLSKSNLAYADLRGAHLRGVDLTECKYCPSGTKGETLWPQGFVPEGCSDSPPRICEEPWASSR